MSKYERYLARLDHLVAVELVPKVALFDYFTARGTGSDPISVEVQPLLPYLTSAFFVDVTFSISRLYDKKADRSIFDFLKCARNSLESVSWKTPLTEADIDRHEQELHAVSGVHDNLRRRRNKFFGHYGKEYFYEPERLLEDCPFTNDDAKSLVRVLQKIVADHNRALKGSVSMSIEGFVYAAADRLYKKIGAPDW